MRSLAWWGTDIFWNNAGQAKGAWNDTKSQASDAYHQAKGEAKQATNN